MSVALLAFFPYLERWREANNKSVLVPASMWHCPGARMASVIVSVFFAWYELLRLQAVSRIQLITIEQVEFRYDGVLRNPVVRGFIQFAI